MSNDLPSMFSKESTPVIEKNAIFDMLQKHIGKSDDSYAEVTIGGSSDYEDEEVEVPSSYPLYEETPEPAAEAVEEAPKVIEPKLEQDPETYQFSDIDIKNATLHHIKPQTRYRREYLICPGFTVWMTPITDKGQQELNNNSQYIFSTGDKRTRVDVVDSYYDENQKLTVPGGRTETEWYYNPDQIRFTTRANIAAYLDKIGDVSLSGLSLNKRLEILEAYTPQILNVIYTKAYLHFIALLEKTENEILKY